MPCFTTGTWYIWLALSQYMSPSFLKTFRRHSSPAIHAITLASMAEKSETTNRLPGDGMKAVLTSWEKIGAGSPKIISRLSKSPIFTNSLATSSSSSGMVFLARF